MKARRLHLSKLSWPLVHPYEWPECSCTNSISLLLCARRSCRRRRYCSCKMPWDCMKGESWLLYALHVNATDAMHSKFKIPQYQNGQAYLTSHRVCYVDHAEPRKNSVAILLKDVEKPDFYVGLDDLGAQTGHATALTNSKPRPVSSSPLPRSPCIPSLPVSYHAACQRLLHKARRPVHQSDATALHQPHL